MSQKADFWWYYSKQFIISQVKEFEIGDVANLRRDDTKECITVMHYFEKKKKKESQTQQSTKATVSCLLAFCGSFGGFIKCNILIIASFTKLENQEQNERRKTERKEKKRKKREKEKEKKEVEGGKKRN